MKALLSVALLAAALPALVIRTIPYNLVRLDPGLDSILTADAPLEILGEHFGLTQGASGCGTLPDVLPGDTVANPRVFVMPGTTA